ncbi:putative acyltransferase [Microlunatus phosphovorus NM-1]|uniref:citrate synthase (unknown stereospecificity) n=1 Tax=Microlunatus phosphovorus (strain ATCC 700054 / DSM 10555 / JCM 9379 / NBRC 101784 / NCIMB 13414 / VKM Ac-1990 / NM-1) TaxID=1032480 RepID=F5XIJ4_MICPN|nr:citryl-CoA lyase [Microlunatus phosphovorus]BAK38232.1 putative acyltransferase [Microlunatus phosphovorus NM-1]
MGGKSDADLDGVRCWWRTSITDVQPGELRLRGYPIEELIASTSYAGAVWLLITGERPTRTQLRLLDAAMVAGVDHGPQAPSIAAARMSVTCGNPLNSAVSVGVAMLGDTHGGAGQQCMELLERLVESGGGEDTVAEAVASLRVDGGYVPGFGHRFHPQDPRRAPLLALLHEAADIGEIEGLYLDCGERLERALATSTGKAVPINVDGLIALVYCELGLPAPLARGLFCLSRAAGVLAHAWEEMQGGRRIKGPLPPQILPVYDGPMPRHVPTT